MPLHHLHPALSTWMATLDERLATLFTEEEAVLQSAAMGIVGPRGKRLRPLMLMLSCASFGPVTDRTFTLAALVELIHSASLAHDDIVDEAVLRRGMPSAPARWGNKFSVLLGDFIFSRVFELAAIDNDPTVLRLLSSTATEMGRAVILELAGMDLDTTEETYRWVIHGKTAVLFATSLVLGGVVGGATTEQQETLRQAGEAFGCAFQLADDLFDLQGCEEEVGKPLGVDWHQRRATLPLIHALHVAPAAASDHIRALWQHEPFDDAQLSALRELVEAHGGFEYGWQKVHEYRETAWQGLATLPASDGRDALISLCREAFPLPKLPALT